jgi:LCP family protein required for cell wall assembly
MTQPENPPSFSRLDPEHSGRFKPPSSAEPAKRHKVLEWTLFGVLAALVTLSALALYSTYSPSFKEVPNLVDDGISTDRVNILLIGIGGDDHPGGGKDLADAILLVSLKPSTKQVAIVSVPRDLYVKIGRYGRHRLNRAHSIGNQSGYPGAGAALTMATVSEIFDQPIHGFVRVDFRAFEKVIDDLGGVDIDVKTGFYDYLFNDRFQPGRQTMNGDRALRYARYRYIIGDEGDNFAREMRQQQVIDGVRAKLRSQQPSDVLRLLGAVKTVSSHTETNLTTSQIVWMYRNFKDVDREQVRQVSLKPYMEIFELRSIADSGEAVRPKTGDYEELRDLADGVFRANGTKTHDAIRLATSPLMTQPAAIAAAN